MKIPKIKITLNSKRVLKLARLCGAMMCSFGASYWAFFNREKGVLDEWDYISDLADKNENSGVFFRDVTDSDSDRYFMCGKKLAKKVWDSIQEEGSDERTDG